MTLASLVVIFLSSNKSVVEIFNRINKYLTACIHLRSSCSRGPSSDPVPRAGNKRRVRQCLPLRGCCLVSSTDMETANAIPCAYNRIMKKKMYWKRASNSAWVARNIYKWMRHSVGGHLLKPEEGTELSRAGLCLLPGEDLLAKAQREGVAGGPCHAAEGMSAVSAWGVRS